MDVHNKLTIQTWRWPGSGSKTSYPVNFLRNLGVELVRTRVLMHVDVDFVMMRGTYEILLQELPLLQPNRPKRTAFIIPAFEYVPEDYEMGCTEKMGSCRKSRSGSSSSGSSGSSGGGGGSSSSNSISSSSSSAAAADFAVLKLAVLNNKMEMQQMVMKRQAKPSFALGPPNEHSFFEPAHVHLIDYDRWFKATAPYEAKYTSFHNEPYVLVAIEDECLPDYDERFYSYGGDKAEYFNHLFMLNYKTIVLHNVFMYHLPHFKATWMMEDPDAEVRNYKLWITVLTERGFKLKDDVGVNRDQNLTFIGLIESQRRQHEHDVCGV